MQSKQPNQMLRHNEFLATQVVPIKRADLAPSAVCAVCHCDFGDASSEEPYKLRVCGHVTHRDCILVWLNETRNITCPNDSQQIILADVGSGSVSPHATHAARVAEALRNSEWMKKPGSLGSIMDDFGCKSYDPTQAQRWTAHATRYLVFHPPMPRSTVAQGLAFVHRESLGTSFVVMANLLLELSAVEGHKYQSESFACYNAMMRKLWACVLSEREGQWYESADALYVHLQEDLRQELSFMYLRDLEKWHYLAPDQRSDVVHAIERRGHFHAILQYLALRC